MGILTRAWANDPTIVLADELTGNLDSKTGNEIVRLLGKLSIDQETTIVMVTHDSQIVSRAGRMLFLSDGRLLKKERKGTHLMEGALKCPNCHKKIQSDNTFCPHCGKNYE